MAITTLDGLAAAASQKVDWFKSGAVTTVAANFSSFLDVAGTPGAGSLSVANTTTGVVPTAATAGFPALTAFGGGATGYISGISYGSTVAGRFSLKDRIWHAGSILLNSLATTTFASPTSYLSRTLDGAGAGLEIWLEINAAVSATATTVAVGYTNHGGTTGRSTGATASLSGYVTRRLIQLPLQAGDFGVGAVTSVTVGGTVATTGSVNVIVARPLIDGMRAPVANYTDMWGWDKTGLVPIFATSALWPVMAPDSTASGVPEMLITVVNG